MYLLYMLQFDTPTNTIHFLSFPFSVHMSSFEYTQPSFKSTSPSPPSPSIPSPIIHSFVDTPDSVAVVEDGCVAAAAIELPDDVVVVIVEQQSVADDVPQPPPADESVAATRVYEPHPYVLVTPPTLALTVSYQVFPHNYSDVSTLDLHI